MHNERVHNTFWYIGRASIILPIVLIALGLVFRIDQAKQSRQQSRILAQKTPTEAIIDEDVDSTVGVAMGTVINLDQEQKCVFTNKLQDTGVVYIANSNLYGEFTQVATGATTKVLVKGDCAYKWQKFGPTGEQTCGITEYVDLLKNFSSMGLLDVSSLIDIVSRFGGDDSQATALAGLKPVCAQQKVPDTIFSIDPGVTFTKNTISKPTP